mmetsp:Transcript_39661/g.53940  ORF Transcript_39661/g.53940 Transcript_39661/m.53940 type:complete len:285 (+) Transcript_39661:745-1599(+)
MFSRATGFRSVRKVALGAQWTAAEMAGRPQPAPSSQTTLPSSDSAKSMATQRARTRLAHHMPRPVVSSIGEAPKGWSACWIASSRILTTGQSSPLPSFMECVTSVGAAPSSSSSSGHGPSAAPPLTASLVDPCFPPFFFDGERSLSSVAEGCSSSKATRSVLPDWKAPLSELIPAAFVDRTSMFGKAFRSNRTVSIFPPWEAHWRGLFPLSLQRCWAPAWIRRSAHSVFPLADALWSAVLPLASLKLTSAPASSMASISSISPYRAHIRSSELTSSLATARLAM